jgi:hypothetical protein
MAGFSLTFKTVETERAIRQLKERAPFAIARALNRAAVSTRAVMARAVAADLGLNVGTVREEIRIQEAKPGRGELTARLTVSGKRIPLIDFKARATRRGGVTARLPGGTGRYPNAFIATMRSGHTGVFQRRGAPRLPIYELRGPSLPHVFSKYIPEGLARGEESIQKNLQSELRFALQQQAVA